MQSLTDSSYSDYDNKVVNLVQMIEDVRKLKEVIRDPENKHLIEEFEEHVSTVKGKFELAKEHCNDTIEFKGINSETVLSKSSFELTRIESMHSVQAENRELDSLFKNVSKVHKRLTAPEKLEAQIIEYKRTAVPSEESVTNIEEMGKKFSEILEDRDSMTQSLILKYLKIDNNVMAESAIERIKERQKKADEIDLCFMIDGTASMCQWIEMTMNKVKEILNQVQKIYATTRFRLAAVIYRDFDMGEKSFQIQSFVEDCETIEKFLSTVKAKGGDDGPEDVYGGFRQTLEKLEWRSCTKILIHIGDAPCHRKRFHNAPEDNYPDSGTDAEWQVVFDEMLQLKIDYYFMEIHKVTAKMFGELRKIWVGSKYNQAIPDSQFKVFPISTDSKQFARDIGKVIQESYKFSLHRLERSTKFPKRILEEASKVKNIDLNWSLPIESWILKSGRIISFGHMSSNNLLKRNFYQHNTEFKVMIQKEPFANGVSNIVYAAKIPEIDFKIVAKQPIGKLHNRELMICNLKKHYIAISLAKKFNDELFLIKRLSWARLYFLYPFLLDCDGPYMLEGFIDGGLMKDTSNLDFKNNEKATQHLSAFTHYSYWTTNGELLVCDFQAVNNFLLTDPSIHTKRQTYLSTGDLGVEGIMNFFSKHECNDICNALGLKPPDNLPYLSSVKVLKWVEKKHSQDYQPKLKCWAKLCNRELVSADGKYCAQCRGILQIFTPRKCKNNNCMQPMNLSTYRHILYGEEQFNVCDPCKNERCSKPSKRGGSRGI